MRHVMSSGDPSDILQLMHTSYVAIDALLTCLNLERP